MVLNLKLKMYSRKDILPNCIEFAKNQKRIGRFSWSQKPYNGKIYFEHCFQLLKKNESGQIEKPSKSILVKKKGKGYQQYGILLFTMLKTLDSFLYCNPILTKDSTMEQELANCHAVYDVATYKKRRVCVTIKKYSVNKPPYIQIRLFTAKENEVLKQVAYVNYTLNEFKELAQVLGDLMFVENCNVH